MAFYLLGDGKGNGQQWTQTKRSQSKIHCSPDELSIFNQKGSFRLCNLRKQSPIVWWRCSQISDGERSLLSIFDDACSIVGVSKKSVGRWYKMFERLGTVERLTTRLVRLRWPAIIYDFITSFVEEHPCFYLEEMQTSLKDRIPEVGNISTSTMDTYVRRPWAVDRSNRGHSVLFASLQPPIKSDRTGIRAVKALDSKGRPSRVPARPQASIGHCFKKMHGSSSKWPN